MLNKANGKCPSSPPIAGLIIFSNDEFRGWVMVRGALQRIVIDSAMFEMSRHCSFTIRKFVHDVVCAVQRMAHVVVCGLRVLATFAVCFFFWGELDVRVAQFYKWMNAKQHTPHEAPGFFLF